VSRRVRTVLLSVLAVALLGAAYTAGAVQGESVKPKAAVREALAATNDPTGAAGRTLALTRITVPPKVKLALHHHPGTQIAQVVQGTLTYTVVRGGTVTVRRGSADTGGTVVRTLQPGDTFPIRSGMWVVEQPNVVHRAENKGKKAIVLYLATLFPVGAPPSVAD
jgi:quercetin dioxygenase-like cupin family protein